MKHIIALLIILLASSYATAQNPKEGTPMYTLDSLARSGDKTALPKIAAYLKKHKKIMARWAELDAWPIQIPSRRVANYILYKRTKFEVFASKKYPRFKYRKFLKYYEKNKDNIVFNKEEKVFIVVP
ncbi:hypothetical protein NBRC110019_20640 [Neptunitalea chrysea]|uniref:Uncharacterized protein n=1 Tax=Neptunitalea chrysea TaxID=1647581 RepID=A0A9W6B822_9FLAO|nr:hypothetical protein [Neptunitalea chrysea]GLB53024.1 hypothetical protein NBRC110019_20640 [Neptunitalea chrysea]